MSCDPYIVGITNDMAVARTPTPRTTLRAYAVHADWDLFRPAVSLHAHTSHSREVLADLPVYIRHLLVIGPWFDRELDRRRSGDHPVDFTKGWWHPPVTTREVFELEAAQIDRSFGLDSIVSITDHDNITAGFQVQQLYAARRAPVSVEWTVPWPEGFFHLGVHNVPEPHDGWFARLVAFTAGRSTERLGDILSDLQSADALIVFNHPRRDLGERGIPLISGGDRHALAPNAVLNLTWARSFAEFAAEVRDGVSHVVVMPEYQQHLGGRILDSAADIFASHAHAAGRQRWFDRVSCEWEGHVRPLSYHWPAGGPSARRSARFAC